MVKPNILVCKDSFENEKIYKNSQYMSNAPFSLGILGKTEMSGKTNMVVNWCCRPEFYGKDFKGDNIFIISKSLESDEKLKNMIEYKEIPESNLIDGFDEGTVQGILEFIKDEYQESKNKGEKPEHWLIIFDDMAFNMDLKNDRGVIGELICNGRHFLISCIFTAQRITQLSPTIRTNLKSSIIFKQNNKDIDIIVDDFCYLEDKKKFRKMFIDSTKGKHDFFYINLTNPYEKMYMKNFDDLEY